MVSSSRSGAIVDQIVLRLLPLVKLGVLFFAQHAKVSSFGGMYPCHLVLPSEQEECTANGAVKISMHSNSKQWSIYFRASSTRTPKTDMVLVHVRIVILEPNVQPVWQFSLVSPALNMREDREGRGQHPQLACRFIVGSNDRSLPLCTGMNVALRTGTNAAQRAEMHLHR